MLWKHDLEKQTESQRRAGPVIQIEKGNYSVLEESTRKPFYVNRSAFRNQSNI